MVFKRKADKHRFVRRTRDMYHNARKRAGGSLPWSLDDLRSWVLAAIAQELCTYCNRQLTLKNFSLDHDVPLSRNGSQEPSNLRICCRRCNTAKSILTGQEWDRLLEQLRTLPEEAYRDVLARLACGSGRFHARQAS